MTYILNEKVEKEKSRPQIEISTEETTKKEVSNMNNNNTENKDKKLSIEEKIDNLSDKISNFEKNGLLHINSELINLKTICIETQNQVKSIRLVNTALEDHITNLIKFIKEKGFVLTSDLKDDMKFDFLTNGDRKRKFFKYCIDKGEVLIKIKIRYKEGSPPSLWFFYDENDWFTRFLMNNKQTIEENRKFKIDLENGNEIIKRIEENKLLNKIFERRDNYFIIRKSGKKRIKYF
jgi:uncharacterized protein YlzI (FlbEa/FlbD family)